MTCDKSRHQGENEDFGRNHGGDRLWAEPVVSSLVVLAVGADGSGALASGATAEVTPLAGEGCRRQGGEEDRKGLHFCDVGEKKVALGGQSGWPDRLVWTECTLQYRADEHKHKRT